MARPQFSESQALTLAQRWGLPSSGLQAVMLAGYDDANMRITDTASGTSCVFKAHNTGDSGTEGQYAEAQNALLAALAAAGFPVPAPLPLLDEAHGGGGDGDGTRSDGFTLRVPAADGRSHAVRLLTWLPGTLLVDVPQSRELARQLGSMLGRINRTLLQQKWDWRATGVLRRQFDWNLECLPAAYARVRPQLLQLEGIDVDVALLDRVVAQFEAATTAAGPQLRRALIHSDANERNVLVDAAGAAAAAAAEQAGGGGAAAAASPPGSDLITGLIDWGDASWQWLAAEPANAAVYLMLLDAHIDDPLPAAAALVGGYESELPLAPAERAALRVLCTGRLAQSLALGAAAAAAQPDNREYVLGTQRNGWRLLRLLEGMNEEAFVAALGGPPAPHDSPYSDWT